MRGIIRKAMKINSWYWIIILSALLVAIWYFTPTADAVTRDEYNKIQADYKTTLDDIKSKETEINAQNKKIKDQQNKISKLKEELREAKSNDSPSWDAIKERLDIENKISDATKELENLRDILYRFLQEKSDFISKSKILKIQVDEKDIDKTDLSHLVKKIGVKLSKTCITMIKNNYNSTCPTYKDIITLDNSNTNISGKFTTDKDGFFHRGKAQVEASWRAYDFEDQLRIFIDPPSGMSERIKTITIHPNFDDYFVGGDMSQNELYEWVDVEITKTFGNQNSTKTIQVLNQTQDYGRVVYHDRFVDKNCRYAIINADKTNELLPDTINLMRNNCDESHTQFITREVIPLNYTEHDYTTTQDYAEKQWLSYVKEFCIFKFKSCN